ncbi:outer membrane lipoprotein-sorting protein [Pseudobdellovibrio sp. HCB154]|uniref:outer membrane lipoprotein-sorting protein n=1 Tax=Pseudobdellovibrio sp. HCB154 TaxID=3386277 RepID=UPI0039173FB2
MKFLILLLAIPFYAKADLASDLLKASDRARGSVKDGVQWNAVIATEENGESSTREFNIKAKGDDAYVEATKPAKNKGEVYIFNDRNMWFFKPSLKKPVSISARQKLTGQAANGDIASTHYARDYSAVIEKTENLNGEKMHVLMLTAKSKNLTYDKIRYWISDKTKLAMKAEFLTLQGKPFKVGLLKYGNTLTAGGETFPFISELAIADAKFQNNKSTITYKAPKVTQVSNSIFNVNNLTR